MASISKIQARQILDSRGNPTVECDLWLSDGSFGRAAVPSGASTGSREALELRDQTGPYLGRSVSTAVANAQSIIFPAVNGFSGTQAELDAKLNQLDGTPNKSRLGANAILAVSLAYAVAGAASRKVPLYRHIAQLYESASVKLPHPMANIMNGGAHADWTTDIQEYMIIPRTDEAYPVHLQKIVEVFQNLGILLKKRGLSIQVGNEGGYAPPLRSNEEAFELILAAISQAGYTAGPNGDFWLGIDAAASEFYRDGAYQLKRDGTSKTYEQMIEWYLNLSRQYPLYSIEDGLAESDWAGWQKLTAALGSDHLLVGDDLLVTNTQYIAQAIPEKSCNALLVKLNQIGTLSETLDAMRLAQNALWQLVPSHRSGETEDTFLAHLTVGTGAGWIKTGAPSRTDRTSKYNELLRINEQLTTEGL
jgi:enolase